VRGACWLRTGLWQPNRRRCLAAPVFRASTTGKELALTASEPTTSALRPPLTTARLILRPWQLDDASAALAVYGHAAVARWLSPAMDRVPDLTAMRLLLQQWIAESARAVLPAGRWAIQRRSDGLVIGGASLLPLPPGREDLEIGWQLHPDSWGHGYATEATYALAWWAFQHDVGELFALVRPGNTRAAASVRRNGMHWVGQTDAHVKTTLGTCLSDLLTERLALGRACFGKTQTHTGRA